MTKDDFAIWFMQNYDCYKKVAVRVLDDWHLAEDCICEAYCHCARRLMQLSDDAKIRPWFWTAVRRQAIRMSEARKSRPSTSIDRPLDADGELTIADGLASAIEDPADDTSKQERNKIVDEELKKLPTEQQEVIRLHIHDDLSFVEMAFKLDLPEATVRTQYKVAMNTLRGRVALRIGEPIDQRELGKYPEGDKGKEVLLSYRRNSESPPWLKYQHYRIDLPHAISETEFREFTLAMAARLIQPVLDEAELKKQKRLNRKPPDKEPE